ncbi:hypothetical protein GN244_ATG08148 [Phytophthora infestans]|uniref:Uncharacterized protein n=1 Tax=Phytophthora infestans TaxID=4787 RepID=A0A833T9L6_PHYIN|nr:hypothetical protein GN244_ATG08148 [Phytophthora infestans]KAF4136474.1 hypothetical protein GN958_ATG14333 [Phytophthora infestans]
MNDTSLVHELVRARLVEIATMRETLERINAGLKRIVQLEFQILADKHEERSYELLDTVAKKP